jgi:hypothetical protein
LSNCPSELTIQKPTPGARSILPKSNFALVNGREAIIFFLQKSGANAYYPPGDIVVRACSEAFYPDRIFEPISK